MKRAEGLLVISRRGFCSGLAGCLGLALVDCTDGRAPVQTGPLGDHPDAGPDAAVDAASTIDSGPGATCPATGATDVGPPSAFLLGKPVYNATGKYFVIRDSGGLYAITARCTHELVIINDDGMQFNCPRHGALFTYNGDVTKGPAFFPLVHYAMCTLANGNVGVLPSQTVPKTQRLNV